MVVGGFLPGPALEFISLTGAFQAVEHAEVKAICLVSESGEPDLFTYHNRFERRPKVPGLWTRFSFRDGDQLDGILSHNLLEWPELGFSLIPPRAGPTRQRVFVPRHALSTTELRGVVGRSPVAVKFSKAAGRQGDQLSIFES